jgi:hypothetical protein
VRTSTSRPVAAACYQNEVRAPYCSFWKSVKVDDPRLQLIVIMETEPHQNLLFLRMRVEFGFGAGGCTESPVARQA